MASAQLHTQPMAAMAADTNAAVKEDEEKRIAIPPVASARPTTQERKRDTTRLREYPTTYVPVITQRTVCAHSNRCVVLFMFAAWLEMRTTNSY